MNDLVYAHFRVLYYSVESSTGNRNFFHSRSILNTAIQYILEHRKNIHTCSCESFKESNRPAIIISSSSIDCARLISWNRFSFWLAGASEREVSTRIPTITCADHEHRPHNLTRNWATLSADYIFSRLRLKKEAGIPENTSGKFASGGFKYSSVTVSLRLLSNSAILSQHHRSKQEAGGLQANGMTPGTLCDKPEGEETFSSPQVDMQISSGEDTSGEVRADVLSAHPVNEPSQTSIRDDPSARTNESVVNESVINKEMVSADCTVLKIAPAESDSRSAELAIGASESIDLHTELAAALAKLTVPEEPGPEDCCGSGCVRCVWDVYDEQLEKYEDKKREVEDQIERRRAL